MNAKEFDEFVEMWDEEGQPPDVDWLEYAQDFRNQTQQLATENAELKRIYRRIQAADHPGLELPVEMTAAMAEMTALLKEEDDE